jgi:hypothetical protein
MMNQLIHHHNLIGHEINESLEHLADDPLDREVYCRRLHTVKEPLEVDCAICPCFAGLEQGHGHECAWEDIGTQDIIIQHKDRYREFERVDKLIKMGLLPNDIYDKNLWIYEKSNDNKMRYILGTKGTKTLLCFGVNPSTATPNELDPTMHNVEFFAKTNGYDSYIMLNLYPVRATNPNDMGKELNKAAMQHNLEVIEKLISTSRFDIWAAWGTLITKQAYLKDCLQKIVMIAKKYDCRWFTIGEQSKNGHPHHPLYLKRNSSMKAFDIDEYLRAL